MPVSKMLCAAMSYVLSKQSWSPYAMYFLTATLARLESQHEALERARKVNQDITESLKKAKTILEEMEEKDTFCGYTWFIIKSFAKGRYSE